MLWRLLLGLGFGAGILSLVLFVASYREELPGLLGSSPARLTGQVTPAPTARAHPDSSLSPSGSHSRFGASPKQGSAPLWLKITDSGTGLLAGKHFSAKIPVSAIEGDYAYHNLSRGQWHVSKLMLSQNGGVCRILSGSGQCSAGSVATLGYIIGYFHGPKVSKANSWCNPRKGISQMVRKKFQGRSAVQVETYGPSQISADVCLAVEVEGGAVVVQAHSDKNPHLIRWNELIRGMKLLG